MITTGQAIRTIRAGKFLPSYILFGGEPFLEDCFILSSLWEDPGFVLLEAGLSNTCVISSNCMNGPREILSSGKNGFLFENNNLNDLLRKFDEFKKQDVSELNTKKKYLKKEIKKFTQFAHFNSLKKIINLVD